MMVEPKQSPLYWLLNEINAAATHGLPIIAVGMTVALPDICVSLSTADGRTDSKKYKKWCEDNLPRNQFSHLTPDDLYSMRCGVLHNGRFGDMQHSVERVLFVPPHPKLTFENVKFNDAFVYSVQFFCRNFTTAAYNWFEANRENPIVQANAERLMQVRDGQSPPYNLGFPCFG